MIIGLQVPQKELERARGAMREKRVLTASLKENAKVGSCGKEGHEGVAKEVTKRCPREISVHNCFHGFARVV